MRSGDLLAYIRMHEGIDANSGQVKFVDALLVSNVSSVGVARYANIA